MQTLDAEGTFWTANDPSYQLFGSLHFDPATGGRLTVQGTFYEDLEALDEGNRPPTPLGRIVGLINGNPTTLENCVCIGRTIRGFGGPSTQFSFVEEYLTHMVLDGSHFQDQEIPTFRSASFRALHLENWVDERMVTTNTLRGPDGHRQQLIAQPRRETTAQAAFGAVRLSSSVSSRFSLTEWQFQQESAIVLDFSRGQSLASVMKHCLTLQHLLTIASHNPSMIFDVRVMSDPIIIPTDSEPQRSIQTRVFAADPSFRCPHEGESPIPPNMLFTFAALGGVDAVARWCDLSFRLEPVIDTLVAPWYAPWADAEDQFFKFLSSAEMSIRMRRKTQQVNLKSALTELARDAGPMFLILVQDIDRWATTIVQTRSNRVIHRGLHEHAATPNWNFLSKSIYFIVVVSLLKECGMAGDQIEAVALKLCAYAME